MPLYIPIDIASVATFPTVCIGGNHSRSVLPIIDCAAPVFKTAPGVQFHFD
jgi:hypothetical protein